MEVQLPLSVQDIEQIIPHRYPFFFVDRVTEFIDGEFIAGQKNVTLNEPYFQGHFPGRPIMPGVIIIEALAQLGVIFAKLMTDGVPPDALMVFSGVESVRFRRQVVPGDVLRLELNSFKRRLVHWKMHGVAKVNGEIAAEAVIKATEIP